MREQSAISDSTKAFSGDIGSPANRIGQTETFLNKVVVKKAYDRKPLLHGRIRQTHPRMEVQDMLAAWVRSRSEVLNVPCDMLSRCSFTTLSSITTEGEIVIQCTTVGINGLRSELLIGLHLEPAMCNWCRCGLRVKLPANVRHPQSSHVTCSL